jgi:hypothetical protein
LLRLAVGIFLMVGMSHAMAAEEPECKLGTVDEIQPAEAIRERITGPDAWVFSETLMNQWDAASVEAVDAVLLMSGPDVMGGNVAFLVAASNPVTEFHAGLVAAWARGGKGDRAASLDWLQRSAKQGYTPAVLALGMALSGPDVIHDGVEFIGEPLPLRMRRAADAAP